mgnify:CR=1 FL=1
MNIEEFLTLAAKEEASDLFIVAGLPLTMKVNGVMRRINEEKMMPQDTEKIIREIYEKALDRDIDQLLKTGDDDFSFAIPGLSRFRVSAYKQRGSLAAVIRVIAFRLPDYKQLRIPEQVMKLSELNKGLVLVTGPAGSGKSTTLACMIEEINETKEDHIITLEDPLEFLHQHKKSIVSQREVNMDTVNYVTSLRAALRQSPDVILLGEMRDYETIQVVMTAAETGHLVFSTLHTIGAANTIERIIDVFPPNQQRQIMIQLASVLQAVLSGNRYPASLYTDTLIRIRSEQGNVTYGRAAIIKAFLIKNYQWKEGEECMGLNESSNETPYILGRLFSVLESIQKDANPGVNTTIRDRYFNSACATPASVFPVLIKLKNSHIKKLEREIGGGSKIYYEKLLTELMEKINAFPQRLSLEEQGKFMLGYYHQTQKKYEKREDK